MQGRTQGADGGAQGGDLSPSDREDQRKRIRSAVQNLLYALNDYGGQVEISVRAIDVTRMGDQTRRYCYNAELAFVARETM